MCAISLALLALLLPQKPVTAIPQPLAASERPAESAKPWGFASSDIPVDPRIHFFTLPNGLRVAWAKNGEPKKRVYLRLHVDVGSLAEDESERGMAHFLEHMAFNGSKNFEAGTLVEWFQEHGMSFGADTNAHTAFSETVYKLDLPENSKESIEEGLVVLRDFASRLDIAEKEVQAEKGVIDGEERERDSAGFRAFVALVERQFAGTRIPVRLPIGTKPIRDAFTAATVRAFYERWYRPENMTLAIVGDLGDLEPEALVREAFGDMRGPGTPVQPEPAMGTPTLAETSFVIQEPEIPISQLVIANLKPYVKRADSVAERKRHLELTVAHAILQLRYSEALKKPETRFLQAQVSENDNLKVFEGGELTVITKPDEWQEGLREALLGLRSALEFGFQQAELDEVRAGMLRELGEAVERERTADSRPLMESILQAAEEDTVPTDADTDLRIHGAILKAMTLKECHDALQTSWTGGTLGLVGIGTLRFDDAAKDMGAVYTKTMEEELKAPESEQSIPFAYASKGQEQPPVVRLSQVEDLGIGQIEYENGVRLNLKPTDFKEREILVRARIGNGRLGMSPGECVVAEVASEVFIGGGLEAHDADSLRRILAGKQARVNIGIQDDSIELTCATSPQDLLLSLELMCAYMEHAGYRPDALYAVRAQIPVLHEQMMRTPQGPLVMDFLPALIQGNNRYSWMGMTPGHAPEELVSVKMEEVRALLEPRLKNSAVEITIIGDFDQAEAMNLVGQTFGELPTRQKLAPVEEGRNPVELQQGLEMVRHIDTKDDKATLVLVYPTVDGLQDMRRRQLFFLGQVVNDRIRL
ncbi:MAG TPA: insulinase family protein, partial [Planctomycetota bacterium]|nr:insulinase family protein [Planctomycetota bacterium]